jgi:hypothetical protein
LQDLISKTWSDNLAAYRVRMAAAQDTARVTLAQHGMHFSVPDTALVGDVRSRMLAQQDTLVQQWRINPVIAQQAFNDANEAG